MDVVELLKRHEGYSRTVYRCTAGRQTIGYGRNLDDVGISEPDGMLKGWNRKVRMTNAISSAWTMTFTVSIRPPSSFFLPCNLASSLTRASNVGGWIEARGLADPGHRGNAKRQSSDEMPP